jgi:uncharacterized membrane protein YeaQ/YmgE (transglycosylase-associated protein family)
MQDKRMDINTIIQKILSIPYAASILGWAGFGLVAGVTAKIILPGQENLGWIRTIGVGIFGAFIGGLVASYFGYHVQVGWNPLGFVAAVVGSIALLLVNRVVTRS